MTAPTETPAPPGPTETAVLLNRGRTITLTDGSPLHVAYSMLSLAELEEEFGDIDSVTRVLEGAAEPTGDQPTRRTGNVRAIGTLLRYGLSPEDRERFPTVDPLLALLSAGQLREVVDTITAVLQEAFGALADASEDPQQPTGETADDSPGATGTTPPPSSSAEPTPLGGP